jgi:hypothetical protein
MDQCEQNPSQKNFENPENQNGGARRLDTYAKKLGYITAIANDFCSPVDIYTPKDTVEQPAQNQCEDRQFADHVFIQPACSGYDTGSTSSSTSNGFRPGGRTCFMDQNLPALGFDYARSWLKVYKGKRRLFTYRSAANHNNLGESSHDLDGLMAKFLLDVLGVDGRKEENLIVRVYSGNGDVAGGPYFQSSQVYERHLPIMINLYPKTWLDQHKDLEFRN